MDAASFYECIKENRLLSSDEDKAAIEVLEKELERRLDVAGSEHLPDSKLWPFLFFQGALLGMMIAYRQTRHHYEITMREKADKDH